MIKLLKLASYLSIALAVSTVVFAGIGITRENDTFSERADFLDKPTVIEQLRELEIPKTDEDKTSPLVVQAHEFALRINPPPPPPPVRPERKNPNHKTRTGIASVLDKAKISISLPTTYKLVGTCRYENFPDKSLALLDVTSDGLLWFRQGDKVGPNIIKKIEDGRIVLLQGGRESFLEVPKQNTVSSLLKGSGGDVTATIAPPASIGSTTRSPGRIPTSASRMSGYSSNRRTVRKRPARPTTEEARKAAEKSTSELKGILDAMSSKKKDGSKAKAGEELMKAVMKMLEAKSKKPPPKKDSSK